jgi:hypothetical protein
MLITKKTRRAGKSTNQVYKNMQTPEQEALMRLGGGY